MTTEPTNEQRAGWAKRALALFTDETYGGDHPDTMDRDDFRTAIQDLIIDLLHLAARNAIDAKGLCQYAFQMFEAELIEACTCNQRRCGTRHDAGCPARPLAAAQRGMP